MMMTDEELISLEEFCASHNIEISFIISLQQYGLVRTTVKENSAFVPLSELPILEKIIRMHYDLDINLEGIETITHLLQRMDGMRSKIMDLQNKLRRYEE